MKTLTAGMQTMLNGGQHTLATLMRLERKDGAIFRFCALDKDMVYAGQTYQSALGYTRTDISTSDALNVDNTNVSGALTSDAITDADLRAGLWDFAEFRLFMVNYEDLTQGEIKLRKGHFGEVTTTRNRFEVELLGMMKAYARIIGRVYAPSCDATLGDARCQKDLTSFTVTGTVEGVSADQITLFDSARTEGGGSPVTVSGVAITGITQADPGVVTTATAHGFIEGQSVVISGVVGMTTVNTAQVVRNPNATTFEIVKTTDFPAYVSGGMATAFQNSGYFDFGLITMTSGLANGFGMEVKSYVPGQIVLQLPLPYAVVAGDTYTLVAGCDKQRSTCVTKFANIVNFRGMPDLRGNDQLVQVGRRQ